MLTETRDYVSCADTAKMVRAALKQAFPGVKFSVRSKVYSGGASISIYWTDGPTSQQVSAITDQFEGADFDGMQDLKTYTTQEYVTSDGRVIHRHFGADFIFPNRTVSKFDEREAAALALIRRECRCEGQEPQDKFGNRWVTDLARQMVHALDFKDQDPMRASFRRVVLLEP